MAFSVTSVAPNHGPAGVSTPVTVGGTDLDTVTRVQMWMTAAGQGSAVDVPHQIVGPTQLTLSSMIAPAPGAGTLFVAPPTGGSFQNFTFTSPPPTITALTPAAGPAGTTVSISGIALDTTTALSVGGAPVPFSIVSSTLVTFVAPDWGLSGPQTVIVRSTLGQTTAVFTYPAAPPVCRRKAWLTLGSRTVQLEDETAGYFCTELDLGYPEVREVTSNRPDQDGIDDRTAFWAGRAVSADISVQQSAGANWVDVVAASFAPFMVPSARPQLHYTLDRGPNSPERVMTVRPADYTWPISGSRRREVHLSWIAADPVARDPSITTATAWAGTTGAQGRTYPLTFPRVYPAGSGNPTSAQLVSPGDVPFKPLLRIYGPISSPVVQLVARDANNAQLFVALIAFQSSVVIDAGRRIDVDLARHTALRDGDPAQSVMSLLNWNATTWPALPPAPAVTTMTIAGTGTTGVSQVQASWQDGYLI